MQVNARLYLTVMEQGVAAPPPLPPKTRRSPPASATVLTNTGADVFTYRFPEVQQSQPDLSNTSENTGSHVVKIRINPQEKQPVIQEAVSSVVCEISPCIRISVNSDSEMIQRNTMSESFIKTSPERNNPYFFCGPFNCGTVMSSGQVSPSDTLDSGTCSDLDSTPPPLPKKKSAGVSVTVIGAHHKRPSSLTSSGAEVDSDDNESNISCDSLNSGELAGEILSANITPPPPAIDALNLSNTNTNGSFLPHGLLQDIRDRSAKLTQIAQHELNEDIEADYIVKNSVPVCQIVSASPKAIIDERPYEDRKKHEKEQHDTALLINSLTYDTDRFYDFHLNEHLTQNENEVVQVKKINEDESFAGYRDFLGGDGSSTIRSAKGTVRGVKNRVRAGIATFLQINSTTKVRNLFRKQIY